MSVYSDNQILKAILDGHVVCCPLVEENIKGSSIDLTLGEFFWRCDANPHGVFNPCDEDEIHRYFAGPFQAKPYAEVFDKIGTRDLRCAWPLPAGYRASPAGDEIRLAPSPFKNIPDDWPVIVLRPGERILTHSHEFVGIRAPGTSMLKARSSSGRIGVKVCDDAGWGDPGFVYRWCWEVRNDNREAIILPVGDRYAQLVLFETGGVRQDYGSIGHYQPTADVAEMIERWTPEDMLPRSYRDQRTPHKVPDADEYAADIEAIKRRQAARLRAEMEELHRQGSASVI